MTTKLLKGALTRFTVMAIAAVFFIPVASAATSSGDMDNPVTGETKTYDYKYVGSGTWTASDWQDANGAALAAAPGTDNSNLWGSMLVNCSNPISVAQLNGWELQLGVFGGANVTVGELGFWTGSDSCFAAVDNASSLTISATTGKNWNNTVKFYVANSRGITFTSAFAPANPNGTGNINYYLKGSGSVTYSDSLGGGVGHVIKQADITLSGTSQIAYKPLVSFTSTTKTFTADATIKRLDSDGTDLDYDVHLAAVTTGSTTLTTDNAVGTCELVQTSTGIDLYWVDGDPGDIPPPAYKPSININFTSGTALSTAADVGLGDYSVPGTSWNNLTVANNATLSALNAVDSTGATSATAASVAITGTRGYWNCSALTAASDLRHGYIDESTSVTTPTVTVSGIPYDKYRVVVYTATDARNVGFGYITINGKNYTYVSDALTEGTSVWGASGDQDTAEAIAEGVNVLVSPVTLGSTLTVVGHRSGDNPRGCIAAIQIVKVEQELEEGDLLIELEGDETYSFDSAGQYNTVYVTGEGTVTFAGTASTATTLHIGPSAAVNMNGSTLTPSAVTGNGTAIYTGATPTTGLGWTDSANWKGTLWVKNTTFTGVVPNTMANANSTLRLSGVVGYFNNGGSKQTCDGTLELENDSYSYAFSVSDGWSTGGITVFAKLKGSGLLGVQSANIAQRYVFKDASEFTGTFNLAARTLRVILGDGESLSPDEGTITIVSGATATVASGVTWTANKNGFRVEGTLNVNGTLASSASAAIKGSGTVVFTGRAPTPTGNAWWKNASWTGTVQMKDVTDLVGSTNWTGTNFLPNDYGNTGSVLELYNCSGWLPNNNNYQCTVPLKVTGTLTINNGISGSKFVISRLSGSGAICTTSNSATVTIQILEAANFTGKVQLNSKRVVFGDTLPSEYTVGNIYVGEGFTFAVPNSDAAWYGTGGITLAGELKAAALSNFGNGTTITTTDTGVFTLVSNSNADDMNVDYTRIQGTGTLKYEGSAYRCISTNNFPTAMIVENNLTAGLLHRIPNLEVTIGSLSGSGYLRSDWGGSAGDRSLKVLQAKDTTWGGNFWVGYGHRIGTLRVAPGASTAGTLTISATHETAESTALQVDSGAKVNLTGTWVGATTVAGTIGGTGTLTGNLTFSAGSTFKAFASDENGLSVSGSITYPASGTVTVDVSALVASAEKVVLLTAENSDIDLSKFALADGTDPKCRLAKEGATLVVKRIKKKVLVIVK